ncbi:hypothetical protein [Pedobacter sp. MW01-1-1]|uniref:hypothetical protein n=1 Tax=Pedobacter sp. MW01-1-1 TaxID=3383027 RepID=UPI003FED8A96
MKENRVKPFQKYTLGFHQYQVENILEISFEGTEEFHSSFNVTLQEKINEDQTKNWLINKVEISSFSSENKFIEILHVLEQNSYPLEVKVDEKGCFLGAVNHQKNIENWKRKTANLQYEYQNIAVFRNQYLLALEDETNFYANKRKEPLWNLLLFAPSYLNTGDKTQESIVWNIKGIGDVVCTGIISAEQKAYGFEALFVSTIQVPEELAIALKNKYPYQLDQYQLELTIKMEYNSKEKHYSSKEANFLLSNEAKTAYHERITMT